MLTTYWNWNVRFRNPTAQSRFGWSLNDSQNNPMKPVYNDSISPGRLPIPTKIKDILSHWQYNHCRFFGPGVCLWITVILGGYLYRSGKKSWVVALLPAILNSGTLLVATPCSNVFRYSFCYVLLLPFFVFMALSTHHKRRKKLVHSKIAVLIPCYNEALTIQKVVSDYKTALPEADIYVYNNNSTDGTAEIARRGGAIVRNEYRQGKGNVIRSMFRDIDADCYLMIDGDDTYPAENASKMCELILDGKADMVIGDRLSSTYFEENKRPFHNFGNDLVRRCINTLWHPKERIMDVMTGYRAFSPMFVKSFPILLSRPGSI